MRTPCTNPGCSRHAPCNACSVVQDGQTIRVPMYMMDSVQRSIATRTRPVEPVTEEQRRAVRAQAAADHYREQHEARERAIAADPRLAAYCAQFR